MKKIFTLLIVWLTLANLAAQNNVYYSRNAILQVKGEFENRLLLGETKILNISLDYETTKIGIRFQPNTIRFNIDTLNEILKNEKEPIIFKGELSLDHINVSGHPPLDFTVEGYLQLGRNKINLNGTGELHHLNDQGEYVGMLGVTFLLNLKDLGLNIPPGMFEEVEIVITQAILEVDKN